MSPRFVISGTDTGIGKTVFSAALTHALQACYWKPVQSGLEEETDSETVERLLAEHPEATAVSRDLGRDPVPHLSVDSLAGVRGTPATDAERKARAVR